VSDEGLGHTITSAVYTKDIVVATDEIFEQTFRLQDLFEASEHMWRSAIFNVTRIDRDGEETWNYTVDYIY
jgi:hypothetical protein